MKVTFELNPYYHINRLHNIHTPYLTFEEYKKWNSGLHVFELGSPTCLKLDFYACYNFWRVHHMHLKNFVSLGLLIKKMYICSYEYIHAQNDP
jgi:hypothetical protein